MTTVVGIRFKKAGKIYYFSPDDYNINEGDAVIVETARGIEYGIAVIGNREIDDSEVVQPLKPILRIATEEDKKAEAENKEKEKEAFDLCVEKIKKHNLNMKLIDVEFTFNLNKIIFYFTAEGRIDFRELVKDLAAVFKTRIELRQIGVRDEAKMLNGIGICGRPLCCSTFLADFQPVSIKMAKDQNLSLNPSKISGICGRLMCCLKYEQDSYEKLNKNMPHEGDYIKTSLGEGEVLSVNILRQLVKAAVRKNPQDMPNISYFNVSEVEIIRRKKRRDNNNEINGNDDLKEILD